ncbi:23S rRNA (adenine(2030)-N(6))-methyltransferase RlmJ [Hyphococcus sp. DH-69]|uniref:23S rRNA (adenine(2030)-N(6))-methyltransferase RlmJ n=1 Tax=Hyphococcus formosus TaxID=3143534 RepID=UPI00398AA659
MNYRHAYHAGNHADVLKHIVIARVIDYLKQKDKPFRVLDAHSGIGLYGLESTEAEKTFEWRDGVGRLFAADGAPIPLSDDAERMIAPWRDAVRSVNNPDTTTFYPGSPEIADWLLRPGDKISLNELHPVDYETLIARYGDTARIKISNLDATAFLKATSPPPERRGLILIDPPYELTDEGERVVRMLREGLKRFATGIYGIWYPVTGDGLDQSLRDAVAAMELKTLDVRLDVRSVERNGGLAGSGMLVINPPWRLADEMRLIMPELADRLSQGKARYSIDLKSE